MSQFDSTLRLFEAMDGLDDTFIEESMLPDGGRPASVLRGRGNRNGLLSRFARSGWAVAILCAVVSLSVLTAIVKLGIGAPAGDSQPPQNQGPANQVTDTLPSETDELPQEAVTLPEESDRVPAGTTSVDEQGLRYKSNGDGTCVCMGFTADEGQTTLRIPNHSPDGDVVISLYAYAFSSCMELTDVTLPAGLRSYDRGTFPMEVEIYHLYGNILYLGTEKNPYMVAVATADNRPGATSLHPHTRLLADRALTYDSGSYFAMKWGDSVPAYTDSEVFSLPSTLAYVGEYALLDVGRDVTYNGYLIGWDSLTASPRTGLIRTVDGQPVTVTCLDGVTPSETFELRDVRVDSGATLEGDVFFGGYYSYYRGINEDYYAYLREPEAYTAIPEQFVTVSAVFGEESRVLTADELAAVRLLPTFAGDSDLTAFTEAFNRDPAALYAGKTVVMVYLTETALYGHTLTDITVTDGRIHITLTRTGEDASDAVGSRFVLIPVEDPNGNIAEYEVEVEVNG